MLNLLSNEYITDITYQLCIYAEPIYIRKEFILRIAFIRIFSCDTEEEQIMANIKDLTGKKFGMLTVLEDLDERENGYCVWLCRCDCGNTVKVNTKRLTSGTMISCGCVQKKGVHCGAKPKDLTGQRFGRLVAEYPTDQRNKKGSVSWHCRCDCGNTVDVTADNLLWGGYRSCGCLRKENRKKIAKRLHHVNGTCVEFLEKRKHRSDNSSGCQGVYRMANGRYKVYIGFRGTKFTLGTYDTFEEAVACRKDAEDQIYGGFLKTYYEWKEKADKDPAWGEEHPLAFTVEKTKENNFVIRKKD